MKDGFADATRNASTDSARSYFASMTSLSPRGVGQWFRAHNRVLERRRPLDVLAEADTNAVRRAAAAFADGAYT
jgi:hypothetical protein